LSLTVAMRFTLGAGDVDFYKEEIENTVYAPAQDLDVQENQSGAPIIYTAGDIFSAIQVTFNEAWKTTLAKIEQLADESATMTMYYKYHYAPAVSETVILSPHEKRKVYSIGGRMPVRHTLTFLVV